MDDQNPYETPFESHDVVDVELVEPAGLDPSRGIVIEKFIALAIVLTMLVALVAAVPRMLM